MTDSGDHLHLPRDGRHRRRAGHRDGYSPGWPATRRATPHRQHQHRQHRAPVTTLRVRSGARSSDSATPAESTLTFSHTMTGQPIAVLLVGISWNCGTTDRTISSVTFRVALPLSKSRPSSATTPATPATQPSTSWSDPPSGVTGNITHHVLRRGDERGDRRGGQLHRRQPDHPPRHSGRNAATNTSGTAVTITGLAGNEPCSTAFMGSSSATTTFTPGRSAPIKHSSGTPYK